MYNRPVIGSLRGGKTYKVVCVSAHAAARGRAAASRALSSLPLSPGQRGRRGRMRMNECNVTARRTLPDAVVGKAHMLRRARCRVRRQRAMAHCHIQAVKGAAAPHGDGLDCWNGTSRLCGGSLVNRRFVRYLGLNQFASPSPVGASGKRRRTRPSPAGSFLT